MINGDWKEGEDEQEHKKSNYVDTSFITSSVTVFELPWRKQDALVNQHHSGMSPSMTEAI